MKKPDISDGFWLVELLEHTVLGIEYDASCIVEDGVPMFCSMPVPNGAPQNLELIAQILRSSAPIPPRILQWIADLFDKNSGGGYKIDKLRKNGRGAMKRGGNAKDWNIAQCFIELQETQMPRKQIIGKLSKEFRVSEIKIEQILKSYRAAIRKDEEIKQENR